MAREMATKTTQKPRSGFGSALGRARAAQQAPAKTAAQQGRVSVWGRLKRYLREVKVEMGKVTWPARKEVAQATSVVIVAVVIASAYIGVLDLIWSYIVKLVRLG
ncbi:MAG: preprotein translocase subunit SecE [Gaiellales bacterium]|nr:preprotein translocase subunit SecE [Gaiellales bacterium]